MELELNVSAVDMAMPVGTHLGVIVEYSAMVRRLGGMNTCAERKQSGGLLRDGRE
jgi:hypothetical protein